MPRRQTVSASMFVATDATTIYDKVSDPTRMGQWSPENLGADLVPSGPTSLPGSYVGMKFDGHNKRFAFRWTTRCEVTAAEPGERFAFKVRAIGVKAPHLRAKIATWDYRFTTVDGGTLVTETWTDDRPWADPIANVFDKIVTRGSNFADFNSKNIHKTLTNLKRVLETPAA